LITNNGIKGDGTLYSLTIAIRIQDVVIDYASEVCNLFIDANKEVNIALITNRNILYFSKDYNCGLQEELYNLVGMFLS
jgi:hypothetical protein